MSKDNILKVIDILENQYFRGDVVAGEAKQIIMLLLGQEHGDELIRL